MEDNSRIDDFYNDLVQSGFTFGGKTDRASYDAMMADDARSKKLYGILTDRGWDLDDYDTWRKGFSSPNTAAGVEPNTAAQPSMATQTANMLQGGGEDGNEFAAQQLDNMGKEPEKPAFEPTSGKMPVFWQHVNEDGSTKPYNMLETERSLDERGNTVQKPKLVKGADGTDVYRNPITGEEYNPLSPEGMEMAGQNTRIVTTDLRKANREQVANLSADIDNAFAEYQKKRPTAISYGTYYGGAAGVTNTQDKEFQTLTAAKQSVYDAQKMIEAADANAKNGTFGEWLNSSFAGGATRGFGDKFFDVRTWDMGLSDAVNNKTLYEALQKADSGQELTKSEQMLLDAKSVEMATNAYFGSYLGRGYQAGAVTAESLPFMLEMAINPASTAGNTAQSMLARYAMKRLGKKASLEALEKGAKGAFRQAFKEVGAKETAKILGGRLAGDLVGSAAMAATTGTGRVTADAFDRMNNGEEDWGTAIAKAYGGTVIENYSEMVGEYFAPVLGVAGKGATAGLKKIGLGKVNDFIEQVGASDLARMVTDFEKNAKWSGLFSEYAEEVTGNIMNALTVGDMTLDTAEGTGVFNLDQNIDTFLGTALIGGALSGIKTLGYRTPKYSARKAMTGADDKAAALFADPADWGNIRNTIAFGTDEDAKEMLADVLGSDAFSAEQKAAVMNYASKAEAYKGVMMAEQKRRGENSGSAQVDVETSYDNGQSLETPQEKNDARNNYQMQSEKALNALGIDAYTSLFDGAVDENGNEIANYPVQALMAIYGSDAFTDEQKQVALDFVNAQATYNGMIDKVRDDIDSQVAASDASIDSRTNRAGANAGMIVPATMKMGDRQVYVIDGDIQMMDDGSMVDVSKSSESILVRDAETGKLEFVSPHDVLNLGQSVSAEQEKATAREAIMQQVAQEQSAIIEGVLPFNAGDIYELADDQGVMQATVLQDNGDGNVTVAVNGQNYTMPKDQVQAMSDAANMKRLADYEQQKNGGEQPAADAAGTVAGPKQRNYALNDEVVLRDADGNGVRGTIVSEPDADGLYEVETAMPINGKRVNQWSADEIGAMLMEHNGEAVSQPAAEATETAGSVQNTGENVINGGESVQTEAMPMVGEGENAEPDFMAVTPERGFAYLFGESGLDESDAVAFLNNNVTASAKDVEKIKGKKPKMGTSIAKFNKDTAEWQNKLNEAEAKAEYWKQMKALRDAEVAERKADEQQRQDAERAAAEADEAAYRAEQERLAAEQAERGANNVDPAIREKWDNAQKAVGSADEIVLANGEKITGHYVLVESGAASPSHDANNGFVKTVGFPVDENGGSVNDRDYERDKDAQRITRDIASRYDSRALQTPVVVSQDGVVLSGNGRTMAGELAAANGTDGAYNQYLMDRAAKYGFTTEQVQAMQHPRVVFVPDAAMPYTAETFAKFNQQEMKSQSKTEQAVKLGKVVDDATFGRIISLINKFETLNEFYGDAAAATEAVKELQKAGVISEAQVTEMYDGDGISNIGRDLLENMLIGKAFESNPDAVRQISAFKSMRQTIIMALNEISNNVKLGEDLSLEEELAAAIDLVYKARKEGGYKDGEKVSGFARQMNLGFYGDEMTVADMNNVTALILADLINDKKTSLLRNTLSDYNAESADAAAGQMDLFSGGVRSKEDILKDLISRFNYGTEQAKTNTRTESAPEAGTAQQVGTESQAGNGGSGNAETAPEQQGDLAQEGVKLSDKVDGNGKRFVLNTSGNVEFGEIGNDTGLTAAPIQLSEGMITDPTTDAGYGLVHIEARHGDEIRNAGYKSVVEFIEAVAQNYKEILAGNDRDGNKTYLLQLKDKHNNTLFVELSGDGTYWNINSAGVFSKRYGNNKETIWSASEVQNNGSATNNASQPGTNAESAEGSNGTASKTLDSEVNTLPAVGSSAITDTAGVAHGTTMGEAITNGNSPIDSQGKGSNNSATEQAKVDENNGFSANKAETESADGNSSSVAAAIAAAEAETDTNPSEAQKEAGNYKKGHVKVDGYDITIENPKGSVRSGKDADGKEWSVTMNNTYGYIRGTEGVDGDHIDVFLSDNPEQGNVYVVDQVDADGNFDEHKVMYGFGSAEEARDNYLANYSEGWKMGTITEVSKEEFKKWIESSHRKTKPFSEYKSVKKEGAQGEEPKSAGGDKAYPTYEAGTTFTNGLGESMRISEVRTDEKGKTFPVVEYINNKGVVTHTEAMSWNYFANHRMNKPADPKREYIRQEKSADGVETPAENKPNTAAATTEVGEKIEDVGEKIGGARKDATLNYAKKIDLEATTPSKIFPKPNFASMEKAGVPHETLVKLKAYYTAFSITNKNKRKRNENQRILSARFYASIARDMLLRDVDVFNESADGIVLTDYGKQHLELLVACVEALDKKVESGFFDLDISDVDITIGEFKENENGAYQTKDGKRWVGSYSYGRTNNMAAVRYKLFALDDIEGLAEEYCKQVEEAHSKNVQNEIKMHVYRVSSGTCYISAKVKGIADEIKLKDGFATSKEAFDYIRENGDALRTEARAKADEMKQGKKNGGTRKPTNDDIERMLRNIVQGTRIGKDYRNGKDVSAEDFMKEFGFRGVEFGNWATQKERQDHLNACYDALMDLADLVGISPKAISLGGKLAMAFGSRGRSSALAHYEPAKHVINLTKEHGAGCVAHEWFHAVDNYFGGGVFGLHMKSAVEGNSRDNLRSEMQKIFAEIGRALNGSDMKSRSKKLGNGDYWASTLEMAARAFESYVNERLMERGQKNQYLSAHVPGEAVEYEELAKNDPYPTAEESKKFGEIFDRLFDTMQEEVGDDGNVNLFQIADVEPGTENVTEAQQLATEAIITALGENAGIDVVMNSQEDGQRVAGMETEANASGTVAASERFDNELSDYKEKRHEGLLHLGAPGAKLRACGVDADNLTLSPKVLNDHLKKHNLSIDDLRGLAADIQNPILVYRHGDNNPNIVIVTEKTVNNGKLSISVELDEDGHVVAVNNVRSVHSKDANKELSRLAELGDKKLKESLRWVENEKVQDWLFGVGLERLMPEEASPELVSVANVLKDFENPKLSDENQQNMADDVEELKRSDGTVYGWSEGNRIHLTPEGINPNTPIHEYTHLWAKAVMQKNPKLWNRIKELLQGTPIWEEVVNDPAYQGLTTDDAIASEALSRLSGRKNAGKMEKMAQDLLNEAKGNGVFAEANAHTLILKMKQALKDFWKWVGTNLFDITDVKNIDEVTDRVLYDMLNKTDLALGENGDVATEFQRGATLDEVNNRYNEQLAGYTTENADSVILNLGMPSEILKKAGVEDKPMKLYGSKIAKKQKKHGFDVNDLRDLPRAMANPIAVFDNYNKEGNRSVLTELKTNDGNILVAVDLGKEKDIDFNIIASAFGKGKSNVEDWLGKGFATYINNEKVQDYLNLAALSAAAADNTELSTGAKIQPNNELNKFLGEKLYIRTENFKNWFGDWQKEPKSASKVVDKNGEPLVVYHGTDAKFTAFDISKFGKTDMGSVGKGFYFGKNESLAKRHGNNVMPVYLDIKNPIIVNGSADIRTQMLAFSFGRNSVAEVMEAEDKFGVELPQEALDLITEDFINEANSHDGVIADGNEYVVKEPTQIKSATENNGEFDAENPDIRFRERTEFDDGEVIDIANVNEKAQKLGLNVEVITDTESLPKNMADKKGWYNKVTGKITIVLPNHSNGQDVMRTLMHEGVAHHGLRQMFGEDFNTFLNNVYANADIEVRRRIAELAARKGWDFHTATEEYLAALAEDVDFERKWGQTWWQKIKFFFVDMLRKAGIVLGDKLTDNDLRYILWKSYERMAYADEHGAIRAARTEVMKQRLGVGNYAPSADAQGTVTGRPAGEAAGTGAGTVARPNTAADDNVLMYRDGGRMDQRDHAIVSGRYEREMQNSMYQFQEAMQDSMLSLKRLMEFVAEKTGEKVKDYENAYMAENALSSKNHAEQELYGKMLFNPMLDEVHRLAKEPAATSGVTEGRDGVTRYMMAKHGLERQKLMEARAYQAGEKSDRDFAGLTGLFETDDLADAIAQAEQLVADFESAHDVTDLWARVNACTKSTLEKTYKSGLLSKEGYETISKMYEYYIPLRGFDATTSDQVYAYLTRERSSFNNPLKKAEGRSSVANDPLATIANMADSAIVQGNKNLMKQKFLKFVMNHPTDVASVNRMWLKKNDITDTWEAVTAQLDENDTPEEILQMTEAFEEKMEQLAQNDPDHYKRGKDAANIPFRTLGNDLNEHMVHVKMGGQDYIITINGNPRVAQALNGLTNPDNESGGAIGAVLKAGEAINRQMSAFYTTRNPEFVLSNFLRDMLYSNSTMWVRETPNYAVKFNKNFIKYNPKQIYLLLQKHNTGTLDMSVPVEKAFYDFMMNGGETGYTVVKDIEKQKKLIKKYMGGKDAKIPVGKAWDLLGEKLDEVNRSVENCARFAAFLTSREMGRTVERSVMDAKEVSVNFNKKGAGSKFLNKQGQGKWYSLGNVGAFTSGLGRSFYVFWNAAVQGTTNFGRLHKNHTAKALAMDAGLFLLGAVLAGMVSDDDDEYYNLPSYVRRSNICFKMPFFDSYITIPLGIEQRAIYGLGELFSSIASGKERMSGLEIAKEIAAALSSLMPVDMMEGNGELSRSALVPSYVKPIVEASDNKDWKGMPIYKDTPWNKEDPEYTKAYDRTNKMLVNMAEALNEWTGGDDVKKGWVDINPAQVEHVLEGTFGGVSTMLNKLVKIGQMATGQQEWDLRNVPMVSRVVKSTDKDAEARRINTEYYKYYNEYKETKRLVSHYEKQEDEGILGMAEKLDFMYNSPEYGRYEIVDEYYDQVKDLTDKLKETVEPDERQMLEEEITDLKREIIEAVRAYDDARNNR